MPAVTQAENARLEIDPRASFKIDVCQEDPKERHGLPSGQGRESVPQQGCWKRFQQSLPGKARGCQTRTFYLLLPACPD